MTGEDFELDEFSFTFPQLLLKLMDKSKRDVYLNRPFQFIERINAGVSTGKYVATTVGMDFDSVIQYWSGTATSGFAYGAMQMNSESRPLRFLDMVGKEPVPPTEQ